MVCQPTLLIASYFPRPIELEGVGAFISSVANGMTANGWKVHLIIPRGLSKLHPSVDPHLYRTSFFGLLYYIRALKNTSKKFDAVLFIENNPNMGISAMFSPCPAKTFCYFYSPLLSLGNLLNNSRRKQMVLHTFAKHWLFSQIQSWSERRCIVPTDFQGQQLSKLGARNVYVYPGGGLPAATNVPKREEARSKLGWHDEIVLGYLGHYSAAKGFDVLIEAFTHSNNSARLALALSGKGSLAPRTAKKLAELRQGNCVIDLGLIDPLLFLSACDVGVFPFITSSFHHLPIAVIECFAAATPVISTRIGGISEIVKPGITGGLAAPGDAIDLAKVINSLISNRESLQEMGMNARKLFEKELSEEVFSDRLSLLLHENRTTKGDEQSECQPT